MFIFTSVVCKRESNDEAMTRTMSDSTSLKSDRDASEPISDKQRSPILHAAAQSQSPASSLTFSFLFCQDVSDRDLTAMTIVAASKTPELCSSVGTGIQHQVSLRARGRVFYQPK